LQHLARAGGRSGAHENGAASLRRVSTIRSAVIGLTNAAAPPAAGRSFLPGLQEPAPAEQLQVDREDLVQLQREARCSGFLLARFCV